MTSDNMKIKSKKNNLDISQIISHRDENSDTSYLEIIKADKDNIKIMLSKVHLILFSHLNKNNFNQGISD